jgi:small subunit ribosomal protein S5
MSDNAEKFIKVVRVGRHAKVVKGGRRFRFGAIVVAGNRVGAVGMGTGGAQEVSEASSKAQVSAVRKMFKVPLKEGRTIHHDVVGRFGSGRIKMRTAPAGTGIIAGGAIRAVCEALGIKDIVVKSLGSSNPHNMIKAAFDAFSKISSPRQIAEKRGKKVSEIRASKPGESSGSSLIEVVE